MAPAHDPKQGDFFFELRKLKKSDPPVLTHFRWSGAKRTPRRRPAQNFTQIRLIKSKKAPVGTPFVQKTPFFTNLAAQIFRTARPKQILELQNLSQAPPQRLVAAIPSGVKPPKIFFLSRKSFSNNFFKLFFNKFRPKKFPHSSKPPSRHLPTTRHR